MNLPRQTYATAANYAAEQEISEVFAGVAKQAQLKVGVDDPKKMKPSIDRLLHKNGVVTCFFEVKQCPRHGFGPSEGPAEGWTTGQRKTHKLRALYELVRVPVLYVVRFNGGTIARVSVMKPYTVDKIFGRSDRGDSADFEGGTRWPWEAFTVIQ